MKASEFITESFNSPYDYDLHNGVEWGPEVEGGSKKSYGITADFKTEDGISYEISGHKRGLTQAEKDKRAAEVVARKEREEQTIASKGHRGPLVIPRNKRSGGIWEIHFYQTGADGEDHINGITGDGNAFRVFATVFAVTGQIVKSYKPSIISIKSKTNEASRNKLYERLAKKYAASFGYEYVNTKVTSELTRVQLKLKA